MKKETSYNVRSLKVIQDLNDSLLKSHIKNVQTTSVIPYARKINKQIKQLRNLLVSLDWEVEREEREYEKKKRK